MRYVEQPSQRWSSVPTRRRGMLMALALGTMSLLHSQSARADDIADLQSLLSEQIVTSASKQAEGASSAPALSSNLSAEDLRRYGIKTLGEAVDFLSLGVATSDDLDGGEIGARGVLLTRDRGSHFLLLIDGHAVNDPVRGSAWFGVGSGIPLELIDHIEVVVGPGSVLYGSNAMLGLINVITKRVKDYQGTRVIAESALPTSLRVGAGAGYKLPMLGKDAEVAGQVEYYTMSGPHLFFELENTGIDRFTGQPGRNSRAIPGNGLWGGAETRRGLYAESAAGNLKFDFGNTELHLRGAYYRHGAPTGTGDFDDPDTGENEKRASFDLKHQRRISNLLQLSGRLYGDAYGLKSSLITSRGSLCPFGVITCNYASSATGWSGGLDLQSTWDWTVSGQFVTIAGLDLRGRKIVTSSDVINLDAGRSLYPAARGLDVGDNTIGAYIQQTLAITRSWNVNGGARADRDSRFPVVVTPRIATSWTAWDGGTLKAAYAEAFRAPSWDETNNTTAHRIAAEPLKPEKVRSIEVSLQQQAGQHRFTVGGFYSQWTDLVDLQALTATQAIQAIRDGKTSVPFTPGVQLYQYKNLGAIDNFGMNSGVEGAFGLDHFHYGVTLTVASAQQSEGGTSSRLPVAPRLFGNARVAYVFGGNLPTVALASRFMGNRAADHAFDGNFVPQPFAPPLVELRLSVSGLMPGVKGLTYRLTGDYVSATRGPYVVGPVTSAIPSQPSAQLIPIDRLRTTIGLQYEL